MEENQMIPLLSGFPNTIPNPNPNPNPFPSTSSTVLLEDQSQLSSEVVLNWFGLLCGSTNIDNNYNNHQKPLSSPNYNDQSVKGNGSEGEKINNKAKIGRKKKAAPQRVAFQTRSDDDVLDDGYRWRKYGQKTVKNNSHPRSYYRCSHHTCNVKKQIQRLSKDSRTVVTTYDGIHNHPCHKLLETLGPLLNQLQFLSTI
ncbi:probable WRKY transcription factor 43 [Humulus lupulus]|uniref:probable WRKY transcription factor 43 n=1 Tax=Humulus lupulus TaxID=3486 RepID=UPI002B4034CE|nr:probable WRKY transcription factor 43 [Humulus lupulus]